MTFTLPLPPNLNGGNKGWRREHYGKKKWSELVDLLSCQRDFPAPPPTPFTRVLVSAVLVMPSAMDDDNATRRAGKWPLDWLKKRRYIVDDSRKYVRWSGFPEQRITRRTAPMLYLTLTPIDDA